MLDGVRGRGGDQGSGEVQARLPRGVHREMAPLPIVLPELPQQLLSSDGFFFFVIVSAQGDAAERSR